MGVMTETACLVCDPEAWFRVQPHEGDPYLTFVTGEKCSNCGCGLVRLSTRDMDTEVDWER